MPRSLIVVLGILFLVFAVGSIGFIWSKCGARTLILGNGGFYAAATGMCD